MGSHIDITGERVVLGTASPRNEQDHIDRYLFAAENVAGKRVLDVACGSGFGSDILLKAGAEQVDGVDVSSEAVKYATETYGQEKINFHCQSADDLPFSDDTFDVIVSFETIEHLEDEVRKKYLTEIVRVLAPDGIVLISTPNKQITTPWKLKPNNPYHVLEYTEPLLVSELSEAGLEVSKLYGQRLVPTVLTWYLIRKGIRLIEVIFRTKFDFYSEASGPGVVKIPSNSRPIFFVAVCKVIL